jgi:hypothetical protein
MEKSWVFKGENSMGLMRQKVAQRVSWLSFLGTVNKQCQLLFDL